MTYQFDTDEGCSLKRVECWRGVEYHSKAGIRRMKDRIKAQGFRCGRITDSQTGETLEDEESQVDP